MQYNPAAPTAGGIPTGVSLTDSLTAMFSALGTSYFRPAPRIRMQFYHRRDQASPEEYAVTRAIPVEAERW